MPFREKMRKAFRRTSTSTSSPSPSPSTSALTPTTSSRSSKPRKSKPPPPDPSDRAPVPKYRGPVNPAHQATLSAFSFGSAAWAARRRSGQSEYSPMGSRVPSRVGSTSSRSGGGGGAAGRRSRRQSYGGGVREAEGDDDVANVGLARHPTAPDTYATDTARPLSSPGGPNGASAAAMGGLEAVRSATNGNAEPVGNGVAHGKPFSEDELALAMTRSTLRA